MRGQHQVSGYALTLVNVLVPLAMLIFASGFFPYKPFLPGLAQYHNLGDRQPPAAPFDKIIFMVIDALRSDFVYSHASGFRFTQSLINDGGAIPFTAHAQAPTVTMPRVKALTTGSIPSFLDMILNLAESDTSSSLSAQDTWLAQMAKKDTGKIIMYGDDTWLKLFPSTFDRADGTTSFFVSDYTEVDHNVTRHVPEQLEAVDWSVMVLHYLGMDHIGHKAGPRSVNMVPKQREMDGIVQQIYTAFETQPHLESTLLILCGDHGMNDVGNHGGSTLGETSPALLLASPKLRHVSKGSVSPTAAISDFDFYDKVEQSDIVPTLAGLLGFPVPLNNLGVFIPNLLGLWPSEDDQVQLLLRNALQLLDMVKVTFPHDSYTQTDAILRCSGSLDTATELACLWKATRDAQLTKGEAQPSRRLLQQRLLSFCRKAQSSLSSTASNYNASRLYAGIAVAVVALSLALYIAAPTLGLPRISAGSGILALAAAYFVMMFASSYVEEEQQFWYWASTAWALAPNGTWSARRARASLITASALRILRRWNQSGQKHAGSPDIANTFLPQHSAILLGLVSLTFVYTTHTLEIKSLKAIGFSKTTSRIVATSLTTSAFIFKLLFTYNDAPELYQSLSPSIINLLHKLPDLIFLARLVFALCGVSCALVLARKFLRGKAASSIHLIDALHPILTVALITQTRAANVPQFLLYALIDTQLHAISSTPASKALASILISHHAFFSNGGSNSIGSLDLGLAYNGLGAYRPGLVGLEALGSNFGGALSVGVLGDHGDCRGEKREGQQRRLGTEAWKLHLAYHSLFMAAMVLGVLGACCALRTHLFVWTVFSPKFLYAVAWFFAWHLAVNVGWCGGLIRLESLAAAFSS